MWRKLFLVLLVSVLCLNAGITLGQEKSYSAERFDVDAAVQEGGSLLVTETVVFRFTGGPFTFVFRELPTDHTDGITGIEASLDGRPLPRGDNAGQVEVEDGDPIRITWHLEPTADSTRTFSLTYRVLGVVRQAPGANVLNWQALPDDYDYPIDSSTVTFTYPAAAGLVAPPEVQAGAAQVIVNDQQVTFTTSDLEPDDPLVVGLHFEPGSLIDSPPVWQARRAAQNAWAPLWIGLSLVLLVAGLVAAAWSWRQHRPPLEVMTGPIYEPPGDLPPAVAGAIAGQSVSPNWSQALGALFDLAGRGVLRIEESPEKKWYRQHDFAVHLVEEPAGLRPHERSLLDLLFREKSGYLDEVKLSQLRSRASSSRWKQFAESLQDELKAMGLISTERRQAQRAMGGWGVALLIVGSLAFTVIGVMSKVTGFWPMSIAVSLVILGVITMIMGQTLAPLSDEGARLAADWKGFHEYLKNVTRQKAAVTRPDQFALYLPYAAAFGLLPQWAKRFEKEEETEMPVYFHALPHTGTGSMAAFVAMTSATASSGGSAAGSAGAGAAGGGASGAG